MSELLKGNLIPWIIVLLAGLSMYAQYYFDIPPINNFAEAVKTSTLVIAAIMIGIGFINLSRTHISKTTSQSTEKIQKYFSIFWLFCCWTTFLTGIIPPIMTHPVYNFFIEYVRVNAQFAASAMFPPWILVAAYRTFKARDSESLLFTISAILVAIGNVPIGAAIWNGFPQIGNWITQKPTAAVFRAISIGIGLGILSLALRLYMRKERSLYRIERS